MNIYKKLAEARVKLQEAELKKSGLNKFAGYEYFELSDFLPKINEINKELGICTVISFGAEYAIMMIIDVDKPEDSIELKSPMKEATLKGCHPIQNLGAIQSYQRRYLYMAAYEIVENDMLDATTGNEPVGGKDNKVSEAQLKRMYALGYKAGYDFNAVKKHVFDKFKVNVEDMTKEQYDMVCNGYEKLKK